MAAIIAFAQHQAFDPDATHVMAAAFEAAWEELKDTGHVATAPFRAQATREALAKRIVAAAQRGIRDPDVLRLEALISLAHPRRHAQAASHRRQPAQAASKAAAPQTGMGDALR